MRISKNMNPLKNLRRIVLTNDPLFLALLSMVVLILLMILSTIVSGWAGFHRDELNFIENARHLDWGYVEYPPLTPFIGWIVLQWAGPSIAVLHFTAALAICIAIWLTGLMAYELGGSRTAQVIAALASGTAPIVLFDTSFFSYQTFDYLWWVLTAYAMIRLLKSQNPRWWLLVGTALGMGMMTKYSIPFLASGIAAGILFTPARRYLKSPYLWAGAALALVIFLPNLIWQFQHHFISLDYQLSTHLRDIAEGRTASFLLPQLYICVNAASVTLWGGGLYYFLIAPNGRRFRPLGWMYLIPLVLFLAAQGRFYYLAGAYPVLIAAGASQTFRRPADEEARLPLNGLTSTWRNLQIGILIAVGVFDLVITRPLAPVNSGWWRLDETINPEIAEEVGWPELVKEVNSIYTALPTEERAQVGILATNYGEAGAIDLYGPAYGLPAAISGINTFWLQGYGNPPPRYLIVLGMSGRQADSWFESCALAGHTPNPYHVRNEETRDHPDIFVCQGVRQPWPIFWSNFRYFG